MSPRQHRHPSQPVLPRRRRRRSPPPLTSLAVAFLGCCYYCYCATTIGGSGGDNSPFAPAAAAPCYYAEAFSPPPLMGIGALFRPNVRIVKGSDAQRQRDGVLDDVGVFFVDAFWTGKVGGATQLSTSQRSSLEREQVMEFKRRYRAPSSTASGGRLPGNMAANFAAGRTNKGDVRSEMVLCVDSSGGYVGCAGVEVDKIKKMDGYDGSITAPVMSNLAVSRKFRRRGLAEEIVKSIEQIARKEWGYDECYLYVEKRNIPAVKLYRKLGYRQIWEDDTATTMLPRKDGRGVANGKTTIVCMKKRLGGGLFGSLFGG